MIEALSRAVNLWRCGCKDGTHLRLSRGTWDFFGCNWGGGPAIMVRSNWIWWDLTVTNHKKWWCSSVISDITGESVPIEFVDLPHGQSSSARLPEDNLPGVHDQVPWTATVLIPTSKCSARAVAPCPTNQELSYLTSLITVNLWLDLIWMIIIRIYIYIYIDW